MTALLRADREQVLAFRLANHHLAARLPPGSMLEAVSACGLQDSPPGSAALALNARIADLTPAEIDRAQRADRNLVLVRSLRTAPHLIPATDTPIFTLGLLPEDEEALRFFIPGSIPALDKVGVSGTELVERAASALLDVLDERVLTFRQASTELTTRLAAGLSPDQLRDWRSPSWYGPNQCLGEALVHFALYVVALKGLFCFAPREGNEASFVRTDQWLGRPFPQLSPEVARAELLRRHFRCFGPTTPARFAEWAGISPAQSERTWKLVESELLEVTACGRRAWLHGADLADFESPPTPTGVRLLPPHDPYLGQRDRQTLLPDSTLHKVVWKLVGNPGVVLAEGRIVGIWRPQKKCKRLVVSIEAFSPLRETVRSEVHAVAQSLAPFKGCTIVETVFAS